MDSLLGLSKMMCRWMCICLLLLLNSTTSSHWCTMSFIDKVFEAGSWDVSLPPLQLPHPTQSKNKMSDTPSSQSTRPTNNGAKKNFVWQAQDIKHLVDTIYINKLYQCTILPSCCNKANKPTNKLCKDMVYPDLSRSLFPARSVDPSHIKFKVHVRGCVPETRYL
ncbi:uncharacterized protein UHO2_00232 [Ustilago hordei]|uniref:uncharacterized protein n=1 Tax=Ustilago hordei TaxID=120017 RepID=UPI001A5CBFB2|nr:uncharacterized protein UHO2_00232 [Ustilago hordei]SYW81728.1 uncharacterized protein UHO2_00232 [Ustilago hordei]